jgi:hypothetical protein
VLMKAKSEVGKAMSSDGIRKRNNKVHLHKSKIVLLLLSYRARHKLQSLFCEKLKAL